MCSSGTSGGTGGVIAVVLLRGRVGDDGFPLVVHKGPDRGCHRDGVVRETSSSRVCAVFSNSVRAGRWPSVCG